MCQLQTYLAMISRSSVKFLTVSATIAPCASPYPGLFYTGSSAFVLELYLLHSCPLMESSSKVDGIIFYCVFVLSYLFWDHSCSHIEWSQTAVFILLSLAAKLGDSTQTNANDCLTTIPRFKFSQLKTNCKLNLEKFDFNAVVVYIHISWLSCSSTYPVCKSFCLSSLSIVVSYVT